MNDADKKDSSPDPSKTQLKKEADKLHDLGASLVKLPMSVLENFSLSDNLMSGIKLAKSIKQNRAIKRQMQYIAKVLRQQDTTQLQKEFQNYHLKINQNNDTFHAYEQWRDRFLNDDKTVFKEFLAAYSDVNRQQLHQLQRNAITENNLEKPPKYTRLLFKFIKDSIEGSTDNST
ncbi:hypothetical protein MNBD_GAMMA12-1079 [hydrothermal vent metagenome]|uniref:Ribosome-associated protein n=1 Tax=hydrothermal vent metagenome TaxID=652676 RepID=A0A3B0YMD3_9ZZZZ